MTGYDKGRSLLAAKLNGDRAPFTCKEAGESLDFVSFMGRAKYGKLPACTAALVPIEERSVLIVVRSVLI